MSSSKSFRERFEEKFTRPSTGCWLWTAGVDRYGYGRVWAGKPYQLAHREAWKLYVGPIPEGMCVLHKCDKPNCVRPRHLWLGTVADNNADKLAKGRERAVSGDAHWMRRHPEATRGEKNNQSKLTDADVIAIRAARALGHTCAAVARRFGISAASVSLIEHRKTWAHVP